MSKTNQGEHVAIIDIGSNTIRLVIYQIGKSRRFYEVENIKTAARLRNHLDKQSFLTEPGIDMLMTTLQEFAEVLIPYSLKHFACVATATIRQAKNQHELISLIKKELNWDMRILTEEEEAYYGYLAIANSTSIDEGITVDMGGGSTEVTYFKNRQLIAAHSFSFGTLTLASLLDQSPDQTKNLQLIQEFIKPHFESLPWLRGRHIPLIAIGGSARNLAQLDQSIKAYPMAGLHQYQMDKSDIEHILTYLMTLPASKLTKLEGLSSDRSDIIIPAIKTFLILFQTCAANRFILSQKGLREGITYQWLLKDQPNHLLPSVVEKSIEELVHDFDLSINQIEHIHVLTKKWFDWLVKKELIPLEQADWLLLKRAAYIFNLGKYIDRESSAQHSFYLITNRTIDGLTHLERLKIALIASFKNKTLFRQFSRPYQNWLTAHERKKLRLLGALLHFTYCLDATKRQVITDFKLADQGSVIQMTLYCRKNFNAEVYNCEKQKKHIERELNKELILNFQPI